MKQHLPCNTLLFLKFYTHRFQHSDKKVNETFEVKAVEFMTTLCNFQVPFHCTNWVNGHVSLELLTLLHYVYSTTCRNEDATRCVSSITARAVRALNRCRVCCNKSSKASWSPRYKQCPAVLTCMAFLGQLYRWSDVKNSSICMYAATVQYVTIYCMYTANIMAAECCRLGFTKLSCMCTQGSLQCVYIGLDFI